MNDSQTQDRTTRDTTPDPTAVQGDVNAIQHGIETRRALPPQLQPGYQAPMPMQLGGLVMSPSQLPPELRGTVVSPQSPAPWALRDPRLRSPDEYHLGQPIWHPRPGERGYQPDTVPVQPQPQVPAPNIDPRSVVQPVSGDQVDPALLRDPTGRNNPGNIRIPGGYGPADFQTFPTMEAGVQAMRNLLLSYQDRYGLNTVAGIIGRYSPPNENPTAQAIQKAAARMGVGPNDRIDLHDPQTMTKMVNALLAQEQAGTGGGGGNPQRVSHDPLQRYIPAEPRTFHDWGRAPPMDASEPGNMPQQQDTSTIMGRFAPLLLGIASLALRLPLSTAVTAYGASERARQNGQDQEYERNRTKYQDALKEATAKQSLESQEYGDAFAQYGENNPEGLQQELAKIALKYNDPAMLRLAEAGDLNRAHQLQAQRDMLNQNLVKGNKLAEEERDRQAQDAAVAAMDRKYQQEHPDATPDELAIAHNEHIGEAAKAGTKTSGTGTQGAETGIYNVLGADGKPTGQQVRLGKDGRYLDPNSGQPVQLKSGETVQERARERAAGAGEGMEGPVYDVIKDGKPTGRQVRAGKQGGLFDVGTTQPYQLQPGETVQQAPREGAGQAGAGEMEGPIYNVIGADGKPTGQQVRAGKRGGLFDAGTTQPVQLKPGEIVQQAPRQSSAGAGGTEGMAVYDVIGKDGKPTGRQVRMGRQGGLFDLNNPPQSISLGEGETVRPVSRAVPPQPAYAGPETWQGAPYAAPPGVDEGLWRQAVTWAQEGRPPVGLGGRTSAMYQQVEPLVPAAMKVLGIQSLADQQIRFDAQRHRTNAIETGFGSGVLGRNLVSLNTVADHISLFRQYAEALRNGDIQRVNQLKNRLATEAGSPEVIDFALAGRITGDEVVRLLTTTGGTLADREDIASRLASYNSPDQFEGAANTLTNYVRGRYAPLRQAYARGDQERERYFDQNMVTPEARRLFQGGQAPIPGAEVAPMTEEQYNAAPSGTRYRMPSDPPDTVRIKP